MTEIDRPASSGPISSGPASSGPAASEVPDDVRITRLANGVDVVSTFAAHVESVSLGAWFGVGARHEPVAVNGVAHLLEHMAFKGTERRDARAIAEEIEAVGGHLNAYTSREQTAYFAKVLHQDSGLAVDVLGDILCNARFEEKELARERAVILQEIGQAADTPDDMIFDLFQETAFPDQALGRPVLGRAEVVGAMSRDAVVDFVAANYGGERMVFAASGKIDHAALVAEVEARFGGLARGTDPDPEAARYQGGGAETERDLEQVHLVLGFPGLPFGDEDFFALQIFSTLLGGGMSSRLFQEVREKRGLVYSIYSFASAYRDAGLFGIYAGTGAAEVAELVPVICDELHRVASADLDAEIARAAVQIKAGLLMSREGVSNRCEQMAQQMLVHGRVLEVEELVAKIEAVDSAAVRRLTARMLSQKPTRAATGPLRHLESFEETCRRFG